MVTTTTTTQPRQDRKARVVRCQVSITDDKGQTSAYTVKPMPKFSDEQGTIDPGQYYRITKHDGTRYECGVTCDAKPYCTCPGFTHHQHCKHVDSLKAIGLIQLDALLDLHQYIRLHAEATESQAKRFQELHEVRDQAEQYQLAADALKDECLTLKEQVASLEQQLQRYIEVKGMEQVITSAAYSPGQQITYTGRDGKTHPAIVVSVSGDRKRVKIMLDDSKPRFVSSRSVTPF